MESIRLLTIGLPNLLDTLVSNAFSKGGVLKSFERCESLKQYFQHCAADEPTLIIVESMSNDDCMHILQLSQRIRLVSIEDSGKRFNLWELIPQKQVLGELSLDELVDRIREKEF